MALIIENGTGISGADSYGTRAGLISFASSYYGETLDDVDATDTPMRRAWAYLNGLPWKGTKTLGRDQAGAWPRTSMIDCDGNEIATDEIPTELVTAQYELARAEKASPGVLSPQGSIRDSLISMENVDVIQVQYDTSRLTPEQAAKCSAVIVESAMRQINCYLINGGRLVRSTYAIVV
jgi:hypothetical protein